MALNFIPISSNATLKAALKQINDNFQQLAAENQTKSISQNGGTALQIGKLNNNSYGIMLSDPSNVRRILVGFKTNGEPIIAVTVKNKDVVKSLGE